MDAARRLDLGRDVAARLSASAGAEAFLAGSLVVGLGSGSSDVDVYLVGAGLQESRRQVVTDGVRVDVQSLAAERLTRLVDRVVADYPAPRHVRVPDLDLVLAVRLVTGQVVGDGALLVGLRERLAARPLPLRRMVVNSWARAAQSAVEDLTGLRRTGDRLDHDAAVVAARRALLAAGKALAAGCGDLYQGEKWVWHQLARSAPDALPLAEFRQLMLHERSEPGAPDAFVALACLVQTCLAAAMTLGWWDAPVDRWPAWTGGGGLLRRRPFTVPCCSDAVTVIVAPGHQVFRVPAGAMLVWGLCNGASVDQVADAAAALSPLAGLGSPLTRGDCELVLRRLTDAALIAGGSDED